MEKLNSLKLNCCDYDAITHYAPGSFCSKYKTILNGNVCQIDQQNLLSIELTTSFLNSKYNTFKTTNSIYLYRVFGQIAASNEPDVSIKGARSLGRFASTEFAESRCDAKMRLALNPAWLNTQMYEEKILVPKGTTIIVGTVASVKLPSGALLPGGADQVLLPEGWSESWIVGYRRITSRQLQIVPKYNLGKPPLFDTKGKAGEVLKNKLFRQICPKCCSENIRKLEDNERFFVKGSKGNWYKMFYTCLEEDCHYYW